MTLFYLEDLIEENGKVKSRRLMKRLRTVYGHFLRIKNWRRVTIVFMPHSINNQVILLVGKKRVNNALKDYLARIELDNKNKIVRITLRNEKYEHEPPIFLDKKNGKTRVRSLSYKTYFPIRKHVYVRLNENGNKKRITILRKNEDVIFDAGTDSVSTKNDDLLRIYDDIQGLNAQSRYISISMNLRAFLHYVVHEDDVIEFNKSVECLAISGKLEDKTENIYRHDPNSKSNDIYQIERQNYSIMEDFPFLSPEYNSFKHILPVNWTFEALKRIGNDLMRDLELLSLEELKYKVTRVLRMYKRI
jgi:hypothetical protein